MGRLTDPEASYRNLPPRVGGQWAGDVGERAGGGLPRRRLDGPLDRGRSCRIWAILAVSAACLVGISSFPRDARADAFDFNDSTWEGCSDLLALARSELGADRVVVQSVLDWSKVKPSDGIILLHPTRSVDVEEATEFMKAGGRLAVLDDYGRGEKLLAHFRIRRRSLPTRPVTFLRSKPALPVAEPAVDPEARTTVGVHPTVAQVDRVIVNHGTGLIHPELTPVLEVRAIGEDNVVFAVAGQVGAGRLFAVGDPSAVINQMLRYPGNRDFARGLIRYLLAEHQPKQNPAAAGVPAPAGRLYLFANQFSERLGFGGVTPLRKSLNKQLRALTDALADVRQNGFPWWLHVAVAGVIGLMLLWWASRALLRGYRRRLPHFARQVPLVSQGGLAGRVAVLSSSASPRGIGLLELRSALLESLSYRFGLSAHVRASQLLAELDRHGELDRKLRTELQSSLSVMDSAERALVSGQPLRVTRRQMLRVADVVKCVLSRCGVDLHRVSPTR